MAHAMAASGAAEAAELAEWRALFQVEGGPTPTPATVKQSLEAERKRASASVLRLAFLEGECGRLQQALQQLHGASQPPRPSLVDPAINALFVKLKDDLKSAEANNKQLEEENHALQFTPNSALGRRLFTRCRQLLAENQALGAQVGEGRVAALEAALAIERQVSAEMRQALAEAQSAIRLLDEELEQMQRVLINRIVRKRTRDEEDSQKSEQGEDIKHEEAHNTSSGGGNNNNNNSNEHARRGAKEGRRGGEEMMEASDATMATPDQGQPAQQ